MNDVPFQSAVCVIFYLVFGVKLVWSVRHTLFCSSYFIHIKITVWFNLKYCSV